MKRISQLVLPVRGDYRLAATLFQPESEEDNRPVVIIASAMGVRRAA